MDKVNEFLDCDLQRRVHLHGRLIFSQAWMTVVWCAAKLCSNLRQRAVCQLRARYMATWRGKAMFFVRFFDFISAILMP